MQKTISILSGILFIAALLFSPQQNQVQNPGCIVQPEVIEACTNGGGQFDYRTCTCVGGGAGNISR